MLGASGDPEVPGFCFRSDTDERWSLPNPTGLPGALERAGLVTAESTILPALLGG